MHNDFFSLLVNGKEYQLRPNFQVAVGIQSRTNKTLAQAIFAAKSLSVVDLHAILCAGLAGNGNAIDESALGDAIIADYATKDMVLINAVTAFAEGFFPKIENDGTKKPQAKNQKAG